MKKIEGYKGLAEEMGVPLKKIEEAYADYAQIAQGAFSRILSAVTIAEMMRTLRQEEGSFRQEVL